MSENPKISVSLSFEEVSLPPFRDILILAKKCPHGKNGVAKCMSLLSPEDFELIPLADQDIEGLLVSKRILKKIPGDAVVNILREKVFPYLSQGEIVKVDFTVNISYKQLEISIETEHAGQ